MSPTFEVGKEKESIPPLSQSRHGDMACQSLYVYKHVQRTTLPESEPAARGIEIHQPLIAAGKLFRLPHDLTTAPLGLGCAALWPNKSRWLMSFIISALGRKRTLRSLYLVNLLGASHQASRLIGTPGKLSFEASLNLVGSDRYDECAAICET